MSVQKSHVRLDDVGCGGDDRSLFSTDIDNALAHIRANIEPAREGDPEGVHQLHIGTRRSRSALRLFKPHLPMVVVRYFDKELSDDGLVLGKARDWDVFVSKTLKELPGADDMHIRAIHQQTLAHHLVERLLADPRFESILAKLADWTREVSISQAAIETVVPDLLERLAKRVASRRHAAGINDETSLYRLRKSLKDLWYGQNSPLVCTAPRSASNTLIRLRTHWTYWAICMILSSLGH